MLRATFIGVNRHRDRSIRELSGAVRDATALWALVSDSDTSARTELIADADATTARIAAAIDELRSAASDDVVIFGFSGHGTRNHRLVTYDTDRTQLTATTIGMEQLAEAFKASKAKAILCIIDCCFSGGAPARVLEDTPATKDPGSPLEILAGNGRILLAACSVNEVAYESPKTRHGLLTGALVELFQRSDATSDVLSITSEVLEHVRAAATQLGVVQTPVVLGHVEGGLKLPQLSPGARFFAAFPESRGLRVGNDIKELAAFNLPQAAVDEWAEKFPDGLNDLQLQAVNDGRILDGQSLVVVAPTSSGKTFIGEMAAARAVGEGRRAVFLLPYRALVNEKFDSFQALYGDRLGLRVIRCTGDYSDQGNEFVLGQYDLGLLTYEMFLNLVVANPSTLNSIGLVVIDESQFITDPNRGINVELMLTFVIAARSRGVEPQLIALSAVIGDVNHFDEWLGSARLVTDQRPVPLVEGVLDRNGTFQFVDVDGQEKTESLLFPYDIQVRKDKPSAQDVIVPLVRKLLHGTNEKVIVFRNQRGPAEGCAAYLARDLGLPAATHALEQLPTGDLSSTSASLRLCLAGGTAFHNTNLTREEKQVVERAFRDPASPLRVLGATTTVAAGINTPASTVIIAEQEFIGEDGRQFTVAEYKNMAGRAGRLGFNERGKSIILADTPYDRQVLFRRYVRGALEPLRSAFDSRELETWIVRLLAQVARVPRTSVAQLLVNTYGGYLANREDPSWASRMRTRLDDLMSRMISLGLVEQELDDVQLSLLGRACGQSSLSFRSTMRLVELVKAVGSSITAPDLMALVQALPEADSTWTPTMKKGTKEQIRIQEAAHRYSRTVIQLLQRHTDNGMLDYVARCKRAAILADWIRGVPTESIESAYTTTPFQGKIGYGDIRRFADNTRFHLRAAHQITNVLFLAGGPSQESIDDILKRLEEGLPSDALGLLALPVVIDRGAKLALYGAGVKCVEDVWKLTDEQLKQTIGPAAVSLISKRPKEDAPTFAST